MLQVTSEKNTTAPKAAMKAPDARLLELGTELKKARTAFRLLDRDPNATDEQYERLLEPINRIEEEILNIRATSIAGLRVKAQAVRECHAGCRPSRIQLDDDPTTDVRLATSIVMDLLAFQK